MPVIAFVASYVAWHKSQEWKATQAVRAIGSQLSLPAYYPDAFAAGIADIRGSMADTDAHLVRMAQTLGVTVESLYDGSAVADAKACNKFPTSVQGWGTAK